MEWDEQAYNCHGNLEFTIFPLLRLGIEKFLSNYLQDNEECLINCKVLGITSIVKTKRDQYNSGDYLNYECDLVYLKSMVRPAVIIAILWLYLCFHPIYHVILSR